MSSNLNALSSNLNAMSSNLNVTSSNLTVIYYLNCYQHGQARV